MSTQKQASVLRVPLDRITALREDGKTAEAIRTAETAVDSAGRAFEADASEAPMLISIYAL